MSEMNHSSAPVQTASMQTYSDFRQKKKNLIQNSTPLSISRKTVMVKEVIRLADELAAELLWPTVQDAHIAAKIAPKTFVDGLYVPFAGKNAQPMLSDPLPPDGEADPYTYAQGHWSIRTWARYMLYGGGRIVTLPDGSHTYAEDQNSVFTYFGITPVYSADAKRKLKSELSDELDLIYKGYNILAYSDPDRSCYDPNNLTKQIHLPFLIDYVEALRTVIKTFTSGENNLRNSRKIFRNWNVRYGSNDKKNQLLQKFFQKLGAVLYTVEDLIAYINAAAALNSAAPVSKQDLRPDEFSKQRIPFADTGKVKQLLNDAGLNINDDGYVAVNGNVFIFASTLQHAWTAEQRQKDSGKAMLQKWQAAAQTQKLNYAPMNAAQQDIAYDLLYSVQQRLPSIFAAALYAAHQNAATVIPAADFYRRLGIPTAKKSTGSGDPIKMFILHPKDWDPAFVSVDPMGYYNKLDHQAIFKYLFFGGMRDLNGSGLPCYAEDQDAFFQYFNIPYGYSTGYHALTGGYAQILRNMISQRNTVSHPTPENKRLLTADDMAEYMGLMSQLIQPLCDTVWSGQDDALDLQQKIKGVRRFLMRYGVYAYTIDSIMDSMNLSDCAEKLEEMLVQAGLAVKDHTVLPPVESASFIKILRDAWTIYQIDPQLGIKHLKSQMPAGQADTDVPKEDPSLAVAAFMSPATALESKPAVKPARTTEPAPAPAPAEQSAPVQVSAPIHSGVSNAASPAQRLYESGMRLLNEADGASEQMLVAFSRFMESAQQGYAPAQVQLGRCFEKKVGIQKMDWRKAFTWYKKAAAQGEPEGKFNVGRCYEFGIGTEKDPAMAAVYYAAAMEQLPVARAFMAWCYLEGIGVPEDVSKGQAMIQELAEQNVPAAQNMLGLCYEYGYGVKRDMKSAAEWYQRSADAGNSVGQYNLGRCYARGNGVEVNFTKSFDLYQKAAQDGTLGAIVAIGRKYASNRYHPASESEPRRLAEQNLIELVNQNYAPAQVVLADWYANQECGQCFSVIPHTYRFGKKITPKLKYAVELYSAAAASGNKLGKAGVAGCYRFGIGTEPQMERAIELYQELSDSSYTPAMCELAECLIKTHQIKRQETEQLQRQKDLIDPRVAAQRRIVESMIGSRYQYPSFYSSNIRLSETTSINMVINPHASIPIEAAGWYCLAARNNNRKAQEWMIRYYSAELKQSYDKNTTPKWENALDWAKKAAEQHSREAIEWLVQYYSGAFKENTAAPNWQEAHRWAAKAAQRNQPQDLIRLARMNDGHNPECVFLSPQEVFDLYQKACQLGQFDHYAYLDAMRALADCWETGFGTPVNTGEALRIYLNLWNKNHYEEDIRALARLCELGCGSPEDRRTAMGCIKAAAEEEDFDVYDTDVLAVARFLLAERYLRGGRPAEGTTIFQRLGNIPADDGLPLRPDRKKAIELLESAEKLGSEEAAARLKAIRR